MRSASTLGGEALVMTPEQAERLIALLERIEAQGRREKLKKKQNRKASSEGIRHAARLLKRLGIE